MPASPNGMRPLKCHRCGSAELVLRETRYEHAEYDGGLLVNEQGDLEAIGDGYSSAGDVQSALTRIECESCGHEWRPRRRFTGTGRHDRDHQAPEEARPCPLRPSTR